MFERIELEGPQVGSSLFTDSGSGHLVDGDPGSDVASKPLRSVLIANGASGLGLLLATRFSEQGYEVFVSSKNEARLEDLEAQASQVTTFVCDLALPGVTGGMLAEIGERAGSLDVLIYLSGEPIERNFAVSATLDGIAEEIEAELSGPINLVELAMPLLRGERPATIVFVTSAHAVSTSPTVPVHAAAMAGLRAFARSARHQLAGMAVRVLEIVPPLGQIGADSDLTHRMIAAATLKALRAGEREVFVGPSRPVRRDIGGKRPARVTPWHIAGYG